MNGILSKDDYDQAKRLQELTPVPIERIIAKLDSYLNKNDYDAAERHLRYWLSEADAGHDKSGKLTILNEQIGLYRKLGKERECLDTIAAALSLADSMDMERSVPYGTTLINAATGYRAFNKPEESLPLFNKARTVLESVLAPDDEKLGALYNNMALTLTALKLFREAEEFYHKAIGIMEKQENGALEVAITLLNLADLVAVEAGLEDGEKKIEEYLLKAEELLNTEELPRNGYYAFVCEKCAPAFGYYGFFLTEQELKRRAKEIYEGA